MFSLQELCSVVEVLDRGGRQDLPIRGIHYDSRRVEPGFLFVAIPGFRTDGHFFLRDAAERGAVAAVIQKEAPLPPGMSWIKVENSRKALADLAAYFYGYPSRRLRLFGVTGTNGKTTTTYLIEGILNSAGCATGLLGTVTNRLGGRVLTTEHTTPESLDLQKILAWMADNGAKAVVMEVSSHALSLDRVRGTEFDVAVFTNLTQDHLDFHLTMEDYFNAKAKLFTSLKEGHKPGYKYAVINCDDVWGQRLITLTKVPVITYGLNTAAMVRAENIQLRSTGTLLEVVCDGKRYTLQLKLVGQFNVYNVLAAWAVGWQEGIEPPLLADILSQLEGAPGRFEKVDAGQDFMVIVDYAHTPDGLENVLKTARQVTPGRVIVVFGCGGDRDRTKRPLMGEAAARLSDFCIITSDNPRSEDPEAIIKDILPGVQRVKDRDYMVEVDRRLAIARALEMARAGDTVVIAGKGHETYQVIGDKVLPFDDREVAREELRRLGWER
ncbi:MAG: UDP-N-acetylmuramoyl-L-alanyl-D-glutamate--2,6-diaminopimelate ligase [Thermanaeromonas sp.]|uniref:UDP-N-acetylmuramoyl-L-alanyl-D-glutamate--2, 6-diaminopimelate ligase n=1 Tax=Thermanaeromonas sp. TaxID=2003697 RepID=UPI002440ECDA|nr:UDP-N-acetylmuramoyl-L-alanyl-D-glutamate--2,6-diaminopimelate ligase [Thermanaeromonas sp.]MCG0276991.1 UDP-N-acetylmuramoyl-L-alanyl-D-glutamate--2,6-diaminopimelate ligase [Thermanaeromonas sp.]